MTKILDELLYTKDHEWLKKIDDETALCGITDHAQEMLTDIVFVELPILDSEVNKEDQIAVVESVKAVSDVYSPVAGKIIEVNSLLEEKPELINSDSYGEGWIFKIKLIKLEDLDLLMDAKAYRNYVDVD